MFSWAIVFIMSAAVSGLVGFSGSVTLVSGVARLMFFIFTVLAALALLVAIAMRALGGETDRIDSRRPPR